MFSIRAQRTAGSCETANVVVGRQARSLSRSAIGTGTVRGGRRHREVVMRRRGSGLDRQANVSDLVVWVVWVVWVLCVLCSANEGGATGRSQCAVEDEVRKQGLPQGRDFRKVREFDVANS